MFNLFKRGSMLTGSEILHQVEKGKIEIDPFDIERINPNSYNLSLNKELCVYSRGSKRLNIIPNSESINDISKLNVNNQITINNLECPIYECVSNIDIDYEKFPSAESMCAHILKPIDSREKNEIIRFEIPESGFLLYPGVLYLGRTNERIATDKFIPMINGRSSGGRLGLSVHICAGFGDIGFNGTFTLEISVVEPLIIYPNMEIAQVCFHTPYGKTDILYRGKYYKQTDATPSRMWHEKPGVVSEGTYADIGNPPTIPEK